MTSTPILHWSTSATAIITALWLLALITYARSAITPTRDHYFCWRPTCVVRGARHRLTATADATNLIRIIQETQPTEIYNLAAQSHVQVSFETPEYTANADALGPLRLLEAIRILGLEKREDGFCADAHTPPDGNP